MLERGGFCTSVTVEQREGVGVREGRRTVELGAEHRGPQSKAVFLGFGGSSSLLFHCSVYVVTSWHGERRPECWGAFPRC